jgi:hypothetical protein
MTRQSFLATLFGALLSTAAFAQMGLPTAYVITANPQGVGVEPTFKANKNGNTTPMATGTISNVLAAIAADAVDNLGNRITAYVKFGDGGVLNLNMATAQINENCNFNLSGKITSTSGNSTIKINNASSTISSEADIANTSNSGYAIHNSGILDIFGGKVENTAGGNAVYHNNANQSSFYLSRSPEINGNIFISSGNLRVRTDSNLFIFAPEKLTKPYSITLEEAIAGRLVVAQGNFHASYANYFTLTNPGHDLAVSGNNLVVGGTATQYTVTFKGMNGVVLKEQSVNYGGAATAPTPPKVDGYTFKHWDRAFDNVTSNIIVNAVYELGPATSSSSGDGCHNIAGCPSSSSSDPTPIANHPTPAIHSEAAPTYYTMKGEPVGSTKPQKPGVYLVKQGSSVRKIVVR